MTFTKERLTELSRRENVGAILGEEIAELARIALASLEAEAGEYLTHVVDDGCGEFSDRMNFSLPVGTKLYSATPATVSVPECFKRLLHHAYGMTMGNYWNKGTMAWHHRDKLCRAVEDCRAAMLLGSEPDFREISNSSTNNFRENAETSTKCWCHTCRPVKISDMRFVVCPDCGNKRCPHANDHRNACTGSNEPGQEGSAYPAAPQQEVTQALAKGMERYGDAMQELAQQEVKP
ncbi:hypothetical protein OUHCRE2_48250 [Enterobacter asburiae]|uniref:hypothetical protein n=1 Tax=Enterobacter asburiae TaxID=61645 RepID=UPI001D87D728|nr:hypothetical protein [Enterobacter asburiae]HDS9626680.1 hypothetical protein [Enterobacter asburiae]HDT1963857.1 hypothetical protein [Enterobacter asburiae]HDT4873607.1 hypothetical protein [Enterobacter asburiae]